MPIFLLIFLWLVPSVMRAQSESVNWKIFSLQELLDQQEQSQKRYLPFLNESSISAGIYQLKAGETDQQQPHDKDEIYFILEGTSNFTVEGETTRVHPGDVLFVRATLDHRFSDIREDLKILVWFSGSPKVDHDLQWKKWSASELKASADLAENTWNDFVKIPTLITGLYSLPQKIGGDSVLTHQVDEINYVVKGKAQFQVDGEVVEVRPGSLMWVKAGVGHRFLGLQEDLEVYIMFYQ